MFAAYVLYSPTHDRYYKGHAEDLDKRLKDHNSGGVQATKPFRPWKMYIMKVLNRTWKLSNARNILRQLLAEDILG